MNLKDWISGTVSTKPYLNPICNVLNCANINCETINDEPIAQNITKYIGISSKSVTGTVEQTLEPIGGIGSLFVTSNSLVPGDTYMLKVCGLISCVVNEELTIRLKAGASSDIFLSVIQLTGLPATTGQGFSIDAVFTVFQNGGLSQASISTSMTYIQTANANNVSVSKVVSLINPSTFQTNTSNIIDLTAQWGSSNPGNVITSNVFTLTKIF